MVEGEEQRRPARWGAASVCAPLLGALIAFLAVRFGQDWLYGSPLGGILLVVGVWEGLCAVGLVAAGVSLAQGERPRWVASLGLFVNGVAVFAPFVWHALAP